MTSKKNLVILDSSKMVKTIFKGLLEGADNIDSIIYANDAYDAIDKVEGMDSGIVTLDIESESADGLYFLERQMKANPMPIILVTSNNSKVASKAIKALELGALDCVERPCDIDGFRDLGAVKRHLKQAIKNASNANVNNARPALGEALPFSPTDQSRIKIVAIGASIGGAKAIKSIVSKMPRKAPSILITQHMPQHYIHAFVDSLNHASEMTVTEAKSDQVIKPGHVYVAPGKYNLGVKLNDNGERVIKLQKIDAHQELSSSVDYMFSSLASLCAKDTVGVVLTGAGYDGAAGMKKLKESGAKTIAQTPSTCVISGMPDAAIKNESAPKVCDIAQMAEEILKSVIS